MSILPDNALASLFRLTNGDLFVFTLSIGGPVGGLLLFSLQRALSKKAHTPNERVVKAGGSVFLNSFMKEYGYWWLKYQAKALVALRVHPTTITLAGMAVVMTGCALVGCGLLGLGGLLILLGSLSDMLDGMVARALGLSSTAGEFIDSFTDRYTDMALYFGLMAYLRHHFEWMALIGLAMLGTTAVSYARAKAEALGVDDVPRGPMQRAERAVFLGFAIYFSPSFARHTLGEGTLPYLAIGIVGLIALLTNIYAVKMSFYTVATLRARDAQQTDEPARTNSSTKRSSAAVAPHASATHA